MIPRNKMQARREHLVNNIVRQQIGGESTAGPYPRRQGRTFSPVTRRCSIPSWGLSPPSPGSRRDDTSGICGRYALREERESKAASSADSSHRFFAERSPSRLPEGRCAHCRTIRRSDDPARIRFGCGRCRESCESASLNAFQVAFAFDGAALC